MNLQLIATLVALAISFSTGWRLSENKYLKREREHAEQKLVDQRLSTARAIERERSVVKSQNAAAARIATLNRDAAGARNALVGLHDAAAQALRSAEASHATCIVTATAAADVLNQCSERYRSMAEVADRHASDTQTLVDAWPKE